MAEDHHLFSRLVLLLLDGIPTAAAAAIVRLVEDAEDAPQVEVCHWDRRDADGAGFEPSPTSSSTAASRLPAGTASSRRRVSRPEASTHAELVQRFDLPTRRG